MYCTTNSTTTATTTKLIPCTKENPCPHCSKTDKWCYGLGELTVCNRENPPAEGWITTTKSDGNGKPYYAPVQQKTVRPAQTRYWEYRARDGSPLVRVKRVDDGSGTKKISQQHWDGKKWVFGLGKVEREYIPIYRYTEVQKAIAENRPIITVEGEPCVDLLWNLGLAATCNIGGSGKWRPSDSKDLTGAAIIISPDRDQPGIKHADLIAEDFPNAMWLYPYPESKAWDNLPKSQGLDIADWVQSHNLGAEQIMENLSERRAAIASLQKSFEKKSSNREGAQSNTNKIKHFLAMNNYEERLRFNEMSQQVELDGENCRLDRIYLKISEELDKDLGKELCADIVSELAQKNSYSPVRDYLKSVTGAPINLDELALKYFGTSNKLHAKMLRKTLIGAVARVFEPGCKLDTLCILQGSQGIFKSLFWQKLAGKKWFTDNLNEANEKDEKLKLRRYWILEFSEFETAYRRKEVSQLKAFLSTQVDSLRRPYGRAIEDFPRTSIFCGTTNKQEFLQDPTGERRYWVIPVSQKIPIALLESERDQIWAEAVRCYQAGESWWLSPAEEAQLEDLNRGWQSSDLWETAIAEYLEKRSECTVTDLLEKAIGVDLAMQGRREQMRVCDILRRSDWKKAEKQKRINGKAQWYWEKNESCGVITESCDTPVVTPLNPCANSVSTSMSQPQVIFSTLPEKNLTASEIKSTSDSATQNNQYKESLENKSCDSKPISSQTLTEQSVKGVTTSESQPQLNECEIELLEFIRACDDTDEANHIQKVLAECCNNEAADREKVWAGLTSAEQSKFKALLG